MTPIPYDRAAVAVSLAAVAYVVLAVVPPRLGGDTRLAVVVAGWFVAFSSLVAVGYVIGRALARGGRP